MNVVFIPVRGGSKSIPLKNIKTICGKPLVYWTVKAACGCSKADRVYIATDSEEIKATVEGFIAADGTGLFAKAEVIGRSADSASDTASTESAMLEFAERYEFDNIVLVQATSPLLTSDDLERGFALFETEGTDSVLSVVRQKRFNWQADREGNVTPTNYDFYHRPRRQEFEGYLVENGAFYINSRENLLKYGNRLSGRVKAVEMCEDSFLEIDEPSDWVIIETLMKKNGMDADERTGGRTIKMFLTDCDGCLTDGGMYYSEKGDELKKFNTKDGMGLSLLRERGVLTGIVTGEDVALNRRRAQKLRLDILEGGCKDKIGAIRALCEKHHIDISEVAYVGDDINDLEAIKAVGFGCCPSNAAGEVIAAADYVASKKGGEGAVREIIDKILGGIL